MKKIMIIVACIVIAIATQAQGGYQMTIVPAPEAFKLSGNEHTIRTSGSQENLSYQLLKSDKDGNYVPCGDPIQGTGGPLTWIVDDGNYRATGSYVDRTGCSTQMNGEVTVPIKVVISKTLPIADENVLEETGWSISNYICIAVFLLIVCIMLYGIKKRRKLNFGNHKEMKTPYTGKIYRK